ncbi:HU family DNA-binding protein [Thiomonas delicata]|uniref:Integration host factor subunit beta (IHF-beta) n=1 Tax=Thiomonas delicata TaxID=364030 RepID=A0A238D9Q9_THIDL|nr:HU family DNA-binding protein [Thiomonas delicata]MDE2186633.1 integration host factor subunit beta [Betaproteobacteria bacterium]SBP90047.1 Integration host factor subunit beta (IHF-beta) [Thiomonas delicata]
MNRSDLIARLHTCFPNLRQRDVEEATEVILGGIVQSLVKGKRVEIRNFGSFRVTVIQPRMTRNPRTGETFLRQRTRLPRFRAGKPLQVLDPRSDGHVHRLEPRISSDAR